MALINSVTSPPQVTYDFDQRSQSQFGLRFVGFPPMQQSLGDLILTPGPNITGSAPIPASSAAGSIDIDQSLAIEFPVAAYAPHKSADAIKRPPLRRAKEVAAKRSISNNPQANSEANSKQIEQPTISAY